MKKDKPPARHRTGIGVAGFAALACAAVLFAPEGRLACESPYLTEASPDGRWTLTVCGRLMVFAMPGGGSDAPDWIVLRDEAGAVRGVSSLSMLQLYGATFGTETEWTRQDVHRSMVFELPLQPARGSAQRWWDERIWRLRALIGLTPGDEDLT